MGREPDLGYQIAGVELPEVETPSGSSCPRCGRGLSIGDDHVPLDRLSCLELRKGIDVFRSSDGDLVVSKRFIDAIQPWLCETATVSPMRGCSDMYVVRISSELVLDEIETGLRLGAYCTECESYGDVAQFEGPYLAIESSIPEGLHRTRLRIGGARVIFVGPQSGAALAQALLTGLELTEYTLPHPPANVDCHATLAALPQSGHQVVQSLRLLTESPDPSAVGGPEIACGSVALSRMPQANVVLHERWPSASPELRSRIELQLEVLGDVRGGELRLDRMLGDGWDDTERVQTDCALLFGWSPALAAQSVQLLLDSFSDLPELLAQLDACLEMHSMSPSGMVDLLSDLKCGHERESAFVLRRPDARTVAASKELLRPRSSDRLRNLAARHLSQDWLDTSLVDAGTLTALLDGQAWANTTTAAGAVLRACGYVFSCQYAPRFVAELKYVYEGATQGRNWASAPLVLRRADEEERTEVARSAAFAAEMIGLRERALGWRF